MGQHHLQAGDPGYPGPVQQALLPLDDEADAGEAHGHEVGDGEDHPGSHELSEGRVVGAVDWRLELEGQTGDVLRDVAVSQHAGAVRLEGLGQLHLDGEADLLVGHVQVDVDGAVVDGVVAAAPAPAPQPHQLGQGEVLHPCEPLLESLAVVLQDVDDAPVLGPHHALVGRLEVVEEDGADGRLVQE